MNLDEPQFNEHLLAFSQQLDTQDYVSAKAYAASVREFSTWVKQNKTDLDLAAVTPQDIVNFLKYLTESRKLSPRTANSRLSGLKRFFEWAVEKKLLDANPAAEVSGFPTPPNSKKPDRSEYPTSSFFPLIGRHLEILIRQELAEADRFEKRAQTMRTRMAQLTEHLKVMLASIKSDWRPCPVCGGQMLDLSQLNNIKLFDWGIGGRTKIQEYQSHHTTMRLPTSWECQKCSGFVTDPPNESGWLANDISRPVRNSFADIVFQNLPAVKAVVSESGVSGPVWLLCIDEQWICYVGTKRQVLEKLGLE